MAPKRKHSETDPASELTGSSKKAKKGFTVGPDNLPDGTYRRKVQKIKSTLIHKSKLKRSYAKLKKRELPDNGPAYDPYATAADAPNTEEEASPTLGLHPERQAMLEKPDITPTHEPEPDSGAKQRPRKPHRSKPGPFVKESQLAQQKREEAEARQKVIVESKRQREEKLADRERIRKMTATARKPDRNGQRRLGRESKVLLERVKRLVGK